ncbi:MAG: sulfate adenylyltransferase subunit 1 [Ilumatobacteraceae bacterium]
MRQLRFATIGSVDDGKSTLIGRLLYDSKSIFEDHLDHVQVVSDRRGDEHIDLSLLTDGLRAEREQGITIDVAHRYFATPKRSFVVMDCPGHVQFTRNMVTGASNADLAVVLIDARHGVVEQTMRHSVLTSLLRVPHLVVCVNKMDMVDYSEQRFLEIRNEFETFAEKLQLRDVTFIPLSALKGDNVVERSANMPWFDGSTFLSHIENIYTASDENNIDARFPVQMVVRPRTAEHHDFRGYAGVVAGGRFRVGDDVVVLPSGFTSKITQVSDADGPIEEASPGMSVMIEVADDLSITRGDMLCRPHNRGTVAQEHEAMLCWFDASSQLDTNRTYALKHTTKSTRAKVTNLRYELDITTLHRNENATTLEMNGIGRVTIRTAEPLVRDSYEENRRTGSFILIDEATCATVAAGMILGSR